MCVFFSSVFYLLVNKVDHIAGTEANATGVLQRWKKLYVLVNVALFTFILIVHKQHQLNLQSSFYMQKLWCVLKLSWEIFINK